MTFNLNDMDIKVVNTNEHGYQYLYNGKKYFFKKWSLLHGCYNELVAEKIARRLGIPCCHYIFTDDDGFLGVSSEMIDDENFITMKEFLKSVYGQVFYREFKGRKIEDEEYRTKNTLESIWFALEQKYGDKENGQEIIRNVMDGIVKVFMFDILIGNSDRHTDNLGLIITEDNAEVAKIFDNEELFSDYALCEGSYSIYVEDSDYYEKINSIEKFFSISAKEYEEEFKKYLDVISRESIEEIFKELESEDVPIEESIKNRLIDRFEQNRKLLSNYFLRKKVK